MRQTTGKLVSIDFYACKAIVKYDMKWALTYMLKYYGVKSVTNILNLILDMISSGRLCRLLSG